MHYRCKSSIFFSKAFNLKVVPARFGSKLLCFQSNKTASPDRNSLKESFLSFLLASWKVGGGGLGGDSTVLSICFLQTSEIFYSPIRLITRVTETQLKTRVLL